MRHLKKRTKIKLTKRYVKLSHKNKKTRRSKKYTGGATSTTLPMMIDKNNIAYTCTPVPTK